MSTRSRLRRLPLRVRLVSGFIAAMLVLLTGAGAFVYWRVQYALDRGLDAQLRTATATIAPLVGATGRVSAPTTANATGAGWQVLGPDGTVLDSGGPAPSTSMVTAGELARAGSSVTTVELGGFLLDRDDPYRVRLTRVPGTDDHLLVGVRRAARDEALRELLLQLGLAGLGSLLVAAVVGDVLARAALRPVEQYRRRAEQIAGGADGLRLDVPTERDDEVTRLGHTLNDMLAALEDSLEHERRFVDEASHELRTPLTLLRSRIQLARRRPRTAVEHEAVLDELAVDVTRLSELAERLLELGASGDAAGAAADVDRVVDAVVARRRAAQPERAGDLLREADGPAGPAWLDAHTLERGVTNLVENAVAHARPPVTVRTHVAEDGWLRIEVEDAGPGMSPELLESATGRFTRAVEARARPGAGLGLSLVEQVVVRAGGELRLCCAGVHVGHGVATGVPCRHGDAMVVTVLLPVATAQVVSAQSPEPGRYADTSSPRRPTGPRIR